MLLRPTSTCQARHRLSGTGVAKDYNDAILWCCWHATMAVCGVHVDAAQNHFAAVQDHCTGQDGTGGRMQHYEIWEYC